jgi:hypothetical protein
VGSPAPGALPHQEALHSPVMIATSPFVTAGPPPLFLVAFAVMLALFIGGIIWGVKQKKKRQLALAAWADARDFSFAPDETPAIEHQFPSFSVLTTGSRRYAYNVMMGDREGRGCWAFDYHYETYSTDSKGRRQTHHHHFSCLVVDSGLYLKPLTIRQENLFDKMKGVFGFDDIDFESAEFSRRFWVTAQDKRWAYDVIHQGTMEFLLDAPRYALELAGPYAMATRSKRFKPEEFDEALALVDGVLDRIPKDIQAQLRG